MMPWQNTIVGLFKEHKLINKRSYPALRRLYAKRFATNHADEIRAAFGDPQSPIRKWLDEHADIRDEFYTAIDSEQDDVSSALVLFRQLFEKFPAKFEASANLAIAVAVVWDNEQGVHRSPIGQHQSVRPMEELGGIANFRYLVEAEDVMQGRIRFLPWEFLLHLVDHRTPWEERRWALAAYLPKRMSFGRCYQDVPYDHPMNKGVAEPRLKGKEHSLPNQLQCGGVCSCQADFAARVGKCIGVPAFSVGGKNKFGDGHAWVMWVELGAVTKNGFTFSLESHGRYRNDKYYVGTVREPHTGSAITDRQLELRLHTVGRDPLAKRHADLLMASYSLLREKTTMDLPDFTWVVFDDMVAFETSPKRRSALFGQLAAMYEQAGRPDLSCKARLKHSEYLEADERYLEAVQRLATAILLFPDEGRYIPRMLDRMEALCDHLDDSHEHLVRFYQELLPKIPAKRGDAPSKFCKEMYRRAVARFQAAGQTKLAQLYEAKLAAFEDME